LTEDIALDFAQGERLVGIEVLGASRLFETPDKPVVVLKDLLPCITKDAHVTEHETAWA
jgi:hypothetical protein